MCVCLINKSNISLSNFIHSEIISRADKLLNKQVERFWAVYGIEDLSLLQGSPITMG